MAPTRTEYKYIQMNEAGVPIFAGTTMKVVELVTAAIAYGWSPEELHTNYPHLTRSQIYSALAYYWDHKADIDAQIRQIDHWAATARQQTGETPITHKLRTQGLL